VRYRDWKVHFLLKNDWFAGSTRKPTMPHPVNLRNDPFEQHMDAPCYPIYVGEKLWTRC
jgi:arylsulfatase